MWTYKIGNPKCNLYFVYGDDKSKPLFGTDKASAVKVVESVNIVDKIKSEKQIDLNENWLIL